VRAVAAAPSHIRRAIVASAVFTLSLVGAPLARAQSAGPQDDRAREYLRAASESYQSLDLDAAAARLREARRRCGRGGCSPRVTAEIAVMQGVISIGGQSDEDAGLRSFVEALQADPRVTVDPQIATPEINSVFSRARRQARGPLERLLHEPVQEQLARAPIPIAVETGQVVPARVELSYRVGQARWRRARMERVGRAFGAEIPCDVTQPGAEISYYVSSYDASDAQVGEAGNEDEPLSVRIVRTRTRPAPSLPGRLPPEVCRDPDERSPLSGSCARDAHCEEGLVCRESVCGRPPPPRPQIPLLALEVGGGLGLVSINGQPAYDEAVRSNPMDPQSPAMCAMVSCPANASGLSTTGYLWGSARAHLGQRVGLGLGVRWQPDAGARTTLANLLVSLRMYYAVTSAGFARMGTIAALYAGTAVGQISARAPGYPGQPFPQTGHVITGLNNANVGARVEHGFGPGVRVGADLGLQFMFPRFVFSADITAFLGVAFL
jgi:hypothetical protein